MATGNDPIIKGYVDSVRLAWAVHLILMQDGIATRDSVSSSSSNDLASLRSCLEVIFSNNVFQFLLDKVLRTAAYQVCLMFLLYDMMYPSKQFIDNSMDDVRITLAALHGVEHVSTLVYIFC